MNELGVDMKTHYPKLLSDIPREIHYLVTMGCGVKCPSVPTKHKEDWGLVDPSGGTLDDFRKTRDIIRDKVVEFIKKAEK